MSENSPKKDLKSLLADKQYSKNSDNYEEAIKTDSYSYSYLAENLSLESLDYKDALLLLTGVEPTGAQVKWDGCQNDGGAWIATPKVDNAAFLNPSLPDFDTLTDFSHEGDPYHFIGDKEIVVKINILKEVNARLALLLKHWLNAAKPHADKNPPKYYIDWALSKNYDIPWLVYAIENGLYDSKQSLEEKPLSNKERETLSIIIAALAKEAKVDITKISKAGELIANMTQLLDLPIGATTIETHLKNVNQAVAKRAK